MLKLRLFFILFILFLLKSVEVQATSPIRSWATDMYNQPSIKSFETGSVTTYPVGAVTSDGIVITSDGVTDNYGVNLPWADFAPDGFRYNQDLTPANPVSKSAESLDNGQYLYSVYCAACHGATANSENRISQLRAVPAIKDLIPTFSEGYLFMRITYGGSILTSMPPLGYSLSEKERWDVVNYIKTNFK